MILVSLGWYIGVGTNILGCTYEHYFFLKKLDFQDVLSGFFSKKGTTDQINFINSVLEWPL